MRALNSSVIFTFREQVRNGMFSADETTKGGIYITSTAEDSSKKLRVVDVHFVGPEVKDVKVGDAVIVTPLMWTDEFKYQGKSYWRTSEEHIIAIVEE
jgi:co-chaperonin GroES (HSP10)